MSNFQVAILGIFGFFIIVAVLIFSGIIPGLGGSKGSVAGEVVLWGTIPSNQISGLMEDFNRQYKPLSVTYIEKNQSSFDKDLVEALASGIGPDIIMLSRELIYRHADKVYPIPYATLSERAFKDTFVEEGELYLTSVGILALPFRLDPMVMYYNRNILSGAGISLPPSSWEEVFSIAPKLVTKDQSGNITQSAVSFGEFRNVNYAKDILVLLTMQAGNPIVEKSGGGFKAVFGDTFGFSLKPADEALRYYTNFSNPVQPVYSWSRSLPNSRDAFLSGSLAFYFGYASELLGLRSQNPHLNFDVAKVPQTKGASAKVTIGRIDGLSVMKSSKNISAALQTVTLMTGPDTSFKLAQNTSLPPPRRDLLANKPSDAYMNVFFDSALMSRGWIDPAPASTSAIFQSLIESVASGRLRVSEAVMNANSELARLFGGN